MGTTEGAERSAAAAGGIRKIIDIDMDAFYASVEQRDNPELRGKPAAGDGAVRRSSRLHVLGPDECPPDETEALAVSKACRTTVVFYR
jgi:hypothetical protein